MILRLGSNSHTIQTPFLLTDLPTYHRGSVVLPSIATNEPLLEEMNHFVEVIRDKTTNRCSGKYATEVVKTLVQTDQSIQSGGTFTEKDSIQVHNIGLKLFLALPVCWLMFQVVEVAMLRSKQPIWLNLYSSKKVFFIQ